MAFYGKYYTQHTYIYTRVNYTNTSYKLVILNVMFFVIFTP